MTTGNHRIPSRASNQILFLVYKKGVTNWQPSIEPHTSLQCYIISKISDVSLSAGWVDHVTADLCLWFVHTFSRTLLARSSSILSWIRFLRYSSNAKGSAKDLAWKRNWKRNWKAKKDSRHQTDLTVILRLHYKTTLSEVIIKHVSRLWPIIRDQYPPQVQVKVKSEKKKYEPSGPTGGSLSRFLWHEATRSISTSPVDGVLAHRWVTSSIKLTGTHLYPSEERLEALREISVFPKNTVQWHWPLLHKAIASPTTTNTNGRLSRVVQFYVFSWNRQCPGRKNPCTFSLQMEAVVFIILRIFWATRAVLKIGEYLTIIHRSGGE